MNAIAAVNEKGYIGRNGTLLYSIPEDMAYFVKMTRGKCVVMGRKTLLSLPGGKGLKNRQNYVLSRAMTEAEALERGVTVVRSPEELLRCLDEAGIPTEEVFVIGGSEIYALLMPYCDTLYITRVLDDAVGDASFPAISGDFTLQKGEPLTSSGYAYSFDIYVRQR
ncbi:MAG: dihydrofolate reductase [Clostridia bacterium]|nr:dihydrofolate reductase [Clostridia bacterium]